MYSKTQRLVLLGYGAFALVTILVLDNRLGRHISSPIYAVLCAPLPFGIGLCAIQNGWIGARYSTIYRDESPVSYWFYVALALAIGIGSFLWGAFDALR